MIRRTWIPKSGGGQRGLGIPDVIDRIVQQAVHRVLSRHYERTFHGSSHGFRPERSCHSAIAEAKGYVAEGLSTVVSVDLSKFFDRVNHQRLLARLSQRVGDGRVLKLIHRMLKAKVVMPDGTRVSSDEGTPQGGPLSPLLSNIVLDELDWELERRGLRFVRYADDFMIFTRTSEAARRVFESVERYLTRKLKLVVNRQKSHVCSTDGVEFLGFLFVGYGGQIRVSAKNTRKFKDRVREITRRNRGVSMTHRYQELRRYFQGWVGYFQLVPIKSFFSELDKWVRRRIRSCYWKQWRRPRTRIVNLRKLGVGKDEAVTHGISSKGPWVMSASQAVHQALSVDYLSARGLASLLEIWTKLAAKKRTA